MGYYRSMKLSDYLQSERGRAARIASALGVKAVMVAQWASGLKQVPPVRAVAIELATQNAVTRSDLRPADWHLIWPELVGTLGAPQPARRGAVNPTQQQAA